MARSAVITTGTGTVTAALLAGGSASILHGITASSAEAAAYYIKFFWEGTGTAPVNISGEGQTTTTPAAGTSIPQITIQVPTTGISGINSLMTPLNNGGRIWYWVSKLAATTDTTALVTGGDVISVVFD